MKKFSCDITARNFDLNDKDSDFKCSICFHILDHDLASPSEEDSHLFCRDCLLQLEKKECPVCRKSFENMNIISCPFAYRQLNNLTVKCCGIGCTWSGLYINAQDHIDKECVYLTYTCQHCTSEFNYVDALSHICDNEPIACLHCDDDVLRHKMDKHLKKCPKILITCTECKRDHIRSESQWHLNYDCLEANVVCICKKIIKRKDLSEHIHKNQSNHLSSLIDMNVAIQKEIDNVNKSIKILEDIKLQKQNTITIVFGPKFIQNIKSDATIAHIEHMSKQFFSNIFMLRMSMKTKIGTANYVSFDIKVADYVVPNGLLPLYKIEIDMYKKNNATSYFDLVKSEIITRDKDVHDRDASDSDDDEEDVHYPSMSDKGLKFYKTADLKNNTSYKFVIKFAEINILHIYAN